MIIKNTLLSSKNLNSAFLSKTDLAGQVMAGSLKVGGGQLTLTNSFLSDSSNAGYLRIDPQGNKVIIYDGVNNQDLQIYSSSGVESLSLRTINGAPSYSSIDVTGSVDHLKLMDASKKNILISGNVEIDSISTSTNPTSLHIQDGTDRYDISMGNRTASHIRLGGSMGATTTKHAEIQTYTTATAKGGNLYINAGGGNVGIGKTTAVHALDVNGSVQASNWFRTVGSTGWYSENFGGGIHMTDSTWVRTYLNKGLHSGTGNIRTDGALIVGDSTFAVTNNGSFAYRGTTLFANTSGRVGIGTNNPTEALEVIGKIKSSQGVYTAGTEGISFSTYGGGFNMTDTTWIRTAGNKNFLHNFGIMRTDGTLHVGDAGATLSVTSGGNFSFDGGTLFANASNNRVGIGTTDPLQVLDVRGDINLTGMIRISGNTAIEFSSYGGGLYMDNTTDIKTSGNKGLNTGTGSVTTNGLAVGSTFNVAVSGNMTYNTNTLFANTAGRVGIGTITPATTLDVVGGIQATGGLNLKGSSSLSFVDYGGGFNMTDTTWLRVMGGKNLFLPSGILRADGTLHVGDAGATLSVIGGGNFAYRTNVLFANTVGNIGIGTVSPATKLHMVGGNQRIDDNGAFINKATIGNANIQLGTTLGIDSREIAFSTAGHIGTIGNNNLTIGTNGATRLTILGTGDMESDASITLKNKNLNVRETGKISFTNASNVQTSYIQGGNASSTLTLGAGSTPNIVMDATNNTIYGNIINNGTISSVTSKVNNITMSEIAGGALSIRSSAMGGAIGAISLGNTAPIIAGNGTAVGIGTATPNNDYSLDVLGGINSQGNIAIGSGNSIFSSKYGLPLLKDIGDGSVEIDAPGGVLNINKSPTSVRLDIHSDIYTKTGTTSTKVLGADGKHFYQGQDTDARYIRATGGDTINGQFTIFGNHGNPLIIKKGDTPTGSYSNFISFFSQPELPNERSGWIGYGWDTNLNLGITNQKGKVIVNGIHFPHNSNFIEIPTDGGFNFTNAGAPKINQLGNFDYSGSTTAGYFAIVDRTGEQVFRQYVNGTQTTHLVKLRVLGEGDASLSSTGHPFEVGDSGGLSIKMDGNEIMATSGNAAGTLSINAEGGDVHINGRMAWHRGNLVVSNSGPSGGENGDIWIEY